MVRTIPPDMGDKLMGAAELFATRGLDGATSEAIADATGIPKATLYYHFSGKEEILAYLFAMLLDEVEQAVADAVSSPGTAAARLELVVSRHLDVFVRHPMASRAMQFELGRAARLPEIAERIEQAFTGPVRDLLEQGGEDGSLRPVSHPRLTATAILGAITTTGINALTVDERRDVEVVADVVATLVLDGLRPRPGDTIPVARRGHRQEKT